jgi:hypothetical protein
LKLCEPSWRKYSKRVTHGIDNADRDGFFGVLREIDGEYSDLVNMRNNLLHGTWFIGFVDADNPEAAKFFVNKFTASATGLKLVDLPVSAKELDSLTARCNRTRTWIGMVEACFVFSKSGLKFKEHFRHRGKQWMLMLSGGTEEPLPNNAALDASEFSILFRLFCCVTLMASSVMSVHANPNHVGAPLACTKK